MSYNVEPVTDYPIVNSYEVSNTQRLWRMWAGAYGDTRGYVWADYEGDAFEHWVEWLDEHEPGVLVSDSEFSDLLDVAARNLGYDSWPQLRDSDSRMAGVALEDAEVDLTPIGHTTMKSGHYICSWEWGLDEVDPGSDEYRAAHARTLEEYLDVTELAEWLRDFGFVLPTNAWLAVWPDGSFELDESRQNVSPGRGRPFEVCVLIEADADEHTVSVQWEYYARELIAKVVEEVSK